MFLAVTLPACGGAADPGQPRASSPANAAIEAFGPRGDTEWPFAFRWKAAGAPPGAVYRVTVLDPVERPLVEQDTRETILQAPHDLEILLPRTRRFLWRVAIVDGNGEVVARTPLTDFTVK